MVQSLFAQALGALFGVLFGLQNFGWDSYGMVWAVYAALFGQVLAGSVALRARTGTYGVIACLAGACSSCVLVSLLLFIGSQILNYPDTLTWEDLPYLLEPTLLVYLLMMDYLSRSRAQEWKARRHRD